MANSQNGWPVVATSAGMDTRPLAGVAFPNGVRPGDVAVIFGWLAQQFHARVEPLVAGWCWGYNNRAVTGGTVPSNHASGTAVDFNAPRHPYGQRDTFTPVQRTAIRQLLAEADGVLRWGGDYTGNHDDMHFEINAGGAAVAALARKLTQAPTPEPPAPADQEEPMKFEAGNNLTETVPTHGRSTLDIFVSMGSSVTIHEMFGVGASPASPPPGGNITFRKPAEQRIDSDRPGPIWVPAAAATRGVTIRYSCDRSFTVAAS